MTQANQRHDATDRMGQLLLSGWIMLQESCSACHFPLFANPKDRSNIKCVNCTDSQQATTVSLEQSSCHSELKELRANLEQISCQPQPTGSYNALQCKIDLLVNELTSIPAVPQNIEYQLNLSKLILNCLQIKSSSNLWALKTITFSNFVATFWALLLTDWNLQFLKEKLPPAQVARNFQGTTRLFSLFSVPSPWPIRALANLIVWQYFYFESVFLSMR